MILIDGLPALGGQAVNSIIGMMVGLFGNPPGNNGTVKVDGLPFEHDWEARVYALSGVLRGRGL